MTALPEMCPLCPRLCPHRSSLPPSLLPLQAARPPYRPCTQLPFQPKVVILTPVGKQAGALWGGAEGVLGDAVCRLTLGSAGRLPTCVWGVGGGPPRLPPHAALERGWLGWGPPSPHRWSLSSSGFTPAIGPEPPCLAAAGSQHILRLSAELSRNPLCCLLLVRASQSPPTSGRPRLLVGGASAGAGTGPGRVVGSAGRGCLARPRGQQGPPVGRQQDARGRGALFS